MKKRSAILFPYLMLLSFYALGQWDCEVTIDYGNNPSGQFAEINDIKIYYETYGDPTKQALLLIHGNGGSIRSNRCQIEFFKNDYYVIVADSRLHGLSDYSPQELSYKLMADDYDRLLDHLDLKSVYVLGHSDGGIIGLLLAILNPIKVKKLITIAPNLRPDNTAIHQWDIDRVKRQLENIEKKIRQGSQSIVDIKKRALLNLMNKYPDIDNSELLKIKAPVLVVAGDEDLIKLDHIVEIYHSLPEAQLFVMPGATHIMIRTEHELLNQMAETFLGEPFKRPKANRGATSN